MLTPKIYSVAEVSKLTRTECETCLCLNKLTSSTLHRVFVEDLQNGCFCYVQDMGSFRPNPAGACDTNFYVWCFFLQFCHRHWYMQVTLAQEMGQIGHIHIGM